MNVAKSGSMRVLALCVSIALGAAAQTGHAQSAKKAQRHGMGLAVAPSAAYDRYQKAPRFRGFLPDRVDLSHRFPHPGEQGEQGSCVAWATAYALRSYHETPPEPLNVPVVRREFSPAYVFNQLKHESRCSGSIIPDALDLMKRDGAIPYSQFPYAADNCATQPTPEQKRIAADFRIKSWSALGHKASLDDIKGQLAHGKPLVFGMTVTDMFHMLRGPRVFDDVDTTSIGSHAMVLVGYDDQREAFRIINSWGRDWGDRGFGWVSYKTVLARNESKQYYMIDEVESPPPPANPPPLIREPSPAPGPAVIIPPPVQPKPEVIAPVPRPPVPAPEVIPGPAPVVVRPPKPPAPAPVVVPPPSPVVVTPPPPPSPVVVTPPPPPSSAELRKVIASRTGNVPCAKIDPSLSKDGVLTLSGYAGAQDDLDRLKTDLERLAGIRQIRSEMALRPWPQCEALLNFAAPLARNKGLQVRLIGGSEGSLKTGDSFAIEVTAPSYPSYIYVSYLQASGEVVNLSWPTPKAPRIIPANAKLVFGGGQDGQPVYRVTPPLGSEAIVVVASRNLLFQSGLPDSSNDRDFLTSYKRAFKSRQAAKADSSDVVAGLVFTRTLP